MVVILLVRLTMLSLMQSYCCEIIRTLEIGNVNESSKDVNGVLVNIGSKVGPCSKIGSILSKKFSPS